MGVMGMIYSLSTIIIDFINMTSSVFAQKKGLMLKALIAFDAIMFELISWYLFYLELLMRICRAFLWFVAAVVLASEWSNVKSEEKKHLKTEYKNAANSAIIFSFFSWIAQVAIMFMRLLF